MEVAFINYKNIWNYRESKCKKKIQSTPATIFCSLFFKCLGCRKNQKCYRNSENQDVTMSRRKMSNKHGEGGIWAKPWSILSISGHSSRDDNRKTHRRQAWAVDKTLRDFYLLDWHRCMPCMGFDVEKQIFFPIDRNVNWQNLFGMAIWQDI